MRAFTAIVGSIATVAGLFVGAVVISPAAQAAEHSIDIVCDDTLGDITIYGEVGDTFVFTLGEGCTDWNLYNVLVFNYDESLAEPGMLHYVSDTCTAYNEQEPPPASYLDCSYNYPDLDFAWWVFDRAEVHPTVVTATLRADTIPGDPDNTLNRYSVDRYYPASVPLTVGGKVAEVDNNVAGVGGVPGDGFKARNIVYGGPGDGSSSGGAKSSKAPVFTLTSSAADRGACWPSVSGDGGTWVQLTATGCLPPVGHDGATLLGWATNPSFPVARAVNGVVVDEEFDGVRMIFIPVDGYTLLSGDNTLYPIWSK